MISGDKQAVDTALTNSQVCRVVLCRAVPCGTLLTSQTLASSRHFTCGRFKARHPVTEMSHFLIKYRRYTLRSIYICTIVVFANLYGCCFLLSQFLKLCWIDDLQFVVRPPRVIQNVLHAICTAHWSLHLLVSIRIHCRKSDHYRDITLLKKERILPCT